MGHGYGQYVNPDSLHDHSYSRFEFLYKMINFRGRILQDNIIAVYDNGRPILIEYSPMYESPNMKSKAVAKTETMNNT